MKELEIDGVDVDGARDVNALLEIQNRRPKREVLPAWNCAASPTTGTLVGDSFNEQ